jgi:hypothetical protein
MAFISDGHFLTGSHCKLRSNTKGLAESFVGYVAVVVLSLEAVLARGMMEEQACCDDQHAYTSITPLG